MTISDSRSHRGWHRHFFETVFFSEALSSLAQPEASSALHYRPQRLQPLGLGLLHALVPGLPFAKGGFTEPLPATDIPDRGLRPPLPQDPSRLFGSKTAALHQRLATVTRLYLETEEATGSPSRLCSKELSSFYRVFC